jgi:oligoendopeptidase F
MVMMFTPATTATPSPRSEPAPREKIPAELRWDLTEIFPDWGAWERACAEFEEILGRYSALAGTLARGPAALLEALEAGDQLGQLSYRIWYLPSLTFDQDQRDNEVGARRQRAQALLARSQTETAWFRPELLQLERTVVEGWLADNERLAGYRFALEELWRQQQHVLDASGERILALAGPIGEAPADAYSALSTSDMKFPRVTLSTGEQVEVTYGRYRALLSTCREQGDRARVFRAFHQAWKRNANTWAALYYGVCQRDRFEAESRGYASTLEAALDPHAIPTRVVEELIASTYAGTAPLRRYCRLRTQALGLRRYHLYDGSVSLVEANRRWSWSETVEHVVASVAPLGESYQQQTRRAFSGGWIDVVENRGKRSGAYCAGVYGVHPYVLLNFNETLDDVFTAAHEMGHCLHTLLSHEAQPFHYARYSIFVAEVASTLAEALLLEHLLAVTAEPVDRIELLQHAIDTILATFVTQVLFADFELAAHRLVEAGQPLTAQILDRLYLERLDRLYGDAASIEALYGITWARIPHFFQSPYYVYQYATAFAASSRIALDLGTATVVERQQVVDRYLDLLRAGGSSLPLDQLRAAGVDLTRSEPVAAVIQRLDDLVTRLEVELAALPRASKPPG